jgi:hypothetical protein
MHAPPPAAWGNQLTVRVGSKPGFNLGAEGGPQMPELEELLKGMDGLPDMGGEGKDKCSLM